MHYKIIELKNIQEVHDIFTEDVMYRLNWCFLSTSGIHGTYTTLQEIEDYLNKKEELDITCNKDCNNCKMKDFDCSEYITILVVHPRTVTLKYGEMKITKEDIPKLRKYLINTIKKINDIYSDECDLIIKDMTKAYLPPELNCRKLRNEFIIKSYELEKEAKNK